VRPADEAVAAGFRLLHLAETGSTNDDAGGLARGGDPGRVWIVADRQTAGRGRHGRAWSSPLGNLYASLLLVDPCDVRQAPELGFVAGLSLHDAVADLAGAAGPALALKWPNDLLVGGAKAAGILLEGQRLAGGALAVAIGLGVNVVAAPEDTPYPAATIRSLAPDAARDDLFLALSRHMALRLAEWDRGGGFARIRAAWLERAAGRGERVRLRLPAGEKHGIFVGLDGGGRLQLRTETGVETLDAGDLFFSNLEDQSDVRNHAF